jgi:O-succinylbenzoate synthase
VAGPPGAGTLGTTGSVPRMSDRQGLAALERLGIDPADLRVFALPMVERFRGITVREGVLLRGPAGWGEFCPFAEYDDAVAADWLATAVEAATVGWPQPLRDRVPVNVTVPVVDPQRAFHLVAVSGCWTAKVKVADGPGSQAGDEARVAAVREALGPAGAIRVDANGAWDVDTAVVAINALDAAAGGLQYVEQPCRTIAELAQVRRRVGVPIAADESIRRAQDPLTVAVAGAADIAVIKCTPLGGVRRSLEVAAAAGLRTVVSSALETSVGLAAQLALAGALPELELACGLGTGALLRGDVVADAERLLPVDGALPVPRRAPDPDPDRCRASVPADPGRRAWWLDRLARSALLLDSRVTDSRERSGRG